MRSDLKRRAERQFVVLAGGGHFDHHYLTGNVTAPGVVTLGNYKGILSVRIVSDILAATLPESMWNL